MKRCTKCGEEKPKSEFSKHSATKDKLHTWCKKCRSKYNAKKLKEYQEKNPNYNREKNLKRNYGISLKQYNEIFEKQKGCCAICGKHQSSFGRHFDVDHNHDSGEIRGLLCVRCNTFIGLAQENQDFLLQAIVYLGEEK